MPHWRWLLLFPPAVLALFHTTIFCSTIRFNVCPRKSNRAFLRSDEPPDCPWEDHLATLATSPSYSSTAPDALAVFGEAIASNIRGWPIWAAPRVCTLLYLGRGRRSLPWATTRVSIPGLTRVPFTTIYMKPKTAYHGEPFGLAPRGCKRFEDWLMTIFLAY